MLARRIGILCWEILTLVGPYKLPDHPPDWLVNVGLVLALIGFLVWAVLEYRNLRRVRDAASPRKYFMPTWRLERSDSWPIRRVIPLADAAQIAFDRLQGTFVDDVAREIAKDPLGYMGHSLWNKGETQLWATRPPSNVMVPVPKEEANRLHLTDNNRSLASYSGQEKIEYDNLHMRRVDLYLRIKEMRVWPNK